VNKFLRSIVFHELGGNQFRCVWFVHEKLDWKLFERADLLSQYRVAGWERGRCKS